MVTKVHGTSFPSEALTGNLDFFTVDTLVDIRPSADADPSVASQIALDKLVEVIGTRAQPVILGGVVVNTASNPASIPGYVSGSDTYTVRFAVEHVDAVVVDELIATLEGIAGFTATNILVSKSAVL